LKPWDPPDEKLYPVLDDLLDGWRADFRPGYGGVRVVSDRWSAHGHRSATLVVTDGRIESVTAGEPPGIPPGATMVSLAGKTVMPLLIDVHGHVGFLKDGIFSGGSYGASNIIEQLSILEYYGVGAFLSLGTDIGPDAFRVRSDQRAGKIGGARLLAGRRGESQSLHRFGSIRISGWRSIWDASNVPGIRCSI
jgi:hypothetical protein